MQFYPDHDLQVVVLENGGLLLLTPDGQRHEYQAGASAVWTALDGQDGDPEAAASYLAGVRDVGFLEIRMEVMTWVWEWATTGVISEIWNCSRDILDLYCRPRRRMALASSCMVGGEASSCESSVMAEW